MSDETKQQPQPALTADAVFAARRRRTRQVYVPDWGGTLTIRKLSLTDRDELADAISAYKGKTGLLMFATKKVISACVVKDDGSPAFTAEQIDALADLDAEPLDRVYQECWDFNNLGRNKPEDAAKN